MLMIVFLLFFAIGLILTIAGFSLDLPILAMVGTVMIFFMGMGLLQDGMDVKTGELITMQYGNNFTDNNWDSDLGSAPNNSTDAYLFQENSSDVYDHYDDAGENRFGWMLMALGALGFCLSLFML